MKKLLFLILVMGSFQGFSQTESFSELKKKELHNQIRFNYILIDQPVDKVGYSLEPTMGFFWFKLFDSH
jgi:hypothetical protein